MCNPLEDKIVSAEEIEGGYKYFDNPGDVEFLFVDDVKSAAKFYKRYRYEHILLRNEHPEIFKKIIWTSDKPESYLIKDSITQKYREQLFDIAFKDAVEKA